MATKHPGTGAWEFWETPALVFGATGAVYAFNRVSQALLKILNVHLGVVASCYYDDFPILEAECLGSSNAECVEQVLQLLGWRVAKAPHKLKPFSDVFQALGVELCLAQSEMGVVEVRNKP